MCEAFVQFDFQLRLVLFCVQGQVLKFKANKKKNNVLDWKFTDPIISNCKPAASIYVRHKEIHSFPQRTFVFTLPESKGGCHEFELYGEEKALKIL